EADDPRRWLASLQAIERRLHLVEESFFNRDVGVEQKEPVAHADAAAAIDGTGETLIAAQSANGDAGQSLEAAGGGVERRMVIDDNDFSEPGAGGNRAAELPGQPGGVSPLAEIDDNDAQFRQSL